MTKWGCVFRFTFEWCHARDIREPDHLVQVVCDLVKPPAGTRVTFFVDYLSDIYCVKMSILSDERPDHQAFMAIAEGAPYPYQALPSPCEIPLS